METVFEKRILKCAASNLSEDEVVQSLKESKYFVEGSEVASLDKSDDMYVATVFIPVTASRPFPPDSSNDDAGDFEGPKPKAEGGDSDSKDSEGSSDSSDESPSSDSEPKSEGKSESDGEPKKDSKPSSGGSDQEVVSLLHQILLALQGGGAPKPPMPPVGAPAPGAGPAGPPPAGGPPIGGPQVPGKNVKEVIHKRGLKPGETPPGVTPIGAPAFSSIQGNKVSIDKMSHFQAIAPKEGTSVQEAVNDLTQKYGPHGFRVSQIMETPDDKYAALLIRS